jgi:uncharacterized OB-fold protein
MSTNFIPSPSPLTQPFWDAANQGVLVRQRCSECSFDQFPPQFACRHCLSTSLEWVPSSGLGTLYSFSVLQMSDLGLPLDTPTVLADIDLAEGWHLLTNLDCEVSAVAIGMELQVVWRRLSPEINLPVFREI